MQGKRLRAEGCRLRLEAEGWRLETGGLRLESGDHALTIRIDEREITRRAFPCCFSYNAQRVIRKRENDDLYESQPKQDLG